MTVSPQSRTTNRTTMLLHYKAWADDLAFNNVSVLPPEELTKERPTTFKTILATLNHIYVVDDIFRAHLEGRSHPYTWRNTDTVPPLNELRKMQADMDTWYIDLAGTLSEEDLSEVVEFEFVGGGDGAMSREDILLHLVNHGTYHRGFVGDMMYHIDVPPPQANDLPVFLRDVWQT